MKLLPRERILEVLDSVKVWEGAWIGFALYSPTRVILTNKRLWIAGEKDNPFPEILLTSHFLHKSDYEKSAKYFNKNHYITGLSMGKSIFLGNYIQLNLNGNFLKPRIKIYLDKPKQKEVFKLLRNKIVTSN